MAEPGVHIDDEAIIAKALELGYISERELSGCRKTVASLEELGIEKTLLEALREHRFLTPDRIRDIEEAIQDGAIPSPLPSDPEATANSFPHCPEATADSFPPCPEATADGLPAPDPDSTAGSFGAPPPPEPALDPDPSFVASREFTPPSTPDATADFDGPDSPPDGTMDFSPADIAMASGLPEMHSPSADPDMSAPTAIAGGATMDGSVKERRVDDGPAEDLLSTYEKDLLGSTLGGCRLETQLGKGAMGTVFKATHLALRKVVAVKLLNPSRFYQKKQIEQFFREARAAAAIEHQNIVGVHDVGQERGLYYIVMQFIEGDSLQERIEADGTIAPREAVRLTIEAARGLGVAHDKGIIHRDVKPANLMLTPAGEVKIADFGLAHHSGEHTEAGGDVEIMGTPAYMSPEQIDGRKVDHRADLYSLGVTLYYMTTGRKPFDAPTPMEVLLKHMSERLVPPTQVNPKIPKSLGQVIERLMAKDAESRYATSEDLIKDLKKVNEGGKPRAVAQIEDVINRMEEMAREDAPVVKNRQPVTAAVVSGIVAALCAILFTVALPDIKADSIESYVEVNDLERKVKALYDSAAEFARQNPREIEEIRKGFTRIIDDYDYLDSWAMKARTGIRESERKFADIGRRETKEYLTRSAKERLEGNLAESLLELNRIPAIWLTGVLGREIAGQRARLAADLEKQTGMALVTEGVFLAGQEKREETIDQHFLIQVHEVSNADYAKYVTTGGRAPKHWKDGKVPAGKAMYPVVGVTYEDAAGYALWAGMRLPTALEWERAARGTDGRAYPWGDKFDSRLVNCVNRRLGIKPVTAYPGGASPVGCLNLAGNVNEWTSTLDESGTRRIVKGGAYRSNIWNVQTFSQIAYSESEEDPALAIGFRCVR
ncbi:MAG: protein kinase [Planctomycetota bacterium]